MTCVSGNNPDDEVEEVDVVVVVVVLPAAVEDENRGVRRLLFWDELDEEAVVFVAVLPADVGGVREERFRAALIRTLTVDGILLTTMIMATLGVYYVMLLLSSLYWR